MEPAGIAAVTGASRGIGRAVALELARRGFDVVATMRDAAAGAGLSDEAQEGGGRLQVQALDVTQPDTIRLPDGLRVLVNNAGVEREHLPVEETPLELWRDMFETNVFGLVEVTRRAIPLVRAAGGGVICNMGSSSVLAPVPFYAAYRASKAAVSAISRRCAPSWRRRASGSWRSCRAPSTPTCSATHRRRWSVPPVSRIGPSRIT